MGIHPSTAWNHQIVFVVVCAAGCLFWLVLDMTAAVYADCISVAYTYTCKLNKVCG